MNRRDTLYKIVLDSLINDKEAYIRNDRENTYFSPMYGQIQLEVVPYNKDVWVYADKNSIACFHAWPLPNLEVLLKI